jgi:hypothetical protein
VSTAESIEQHLLSLGAGAERIAPGRWRLAIECAGYPLAIEVALRGPLLRAEAAALPPDAIEPRQLLFWNSQAPLVCFAENRAGEVIVCGELPVSGLGPELLDRFLGLLHASAARARQFVLPG